MLNHLADGGQILGPFLHFVLGPPLAALHLTPPVAREECRQPVGQKQVELQELKVALVLARVELDAAHELYRKDQ